MTACKVTLFHVGRVRAGLKGGSVLPLCGLPVVARGLCAKHYDDRVRLGGAA